MGQPCSGPLQRAVLCAANTVVHIHAILSRTESADGSGMVISSDASGTYILTAAHVVQGATVRRMSVILDDGRAFRALGLAVAPGANPARDVAILRIAPLAIPSVALSDRRPAIGAAVLAAGYPGNAQGDVTGADGVVQGARVDAGDGAGPIYLTHDAPIAPGDSGGPVYDRASGRVIGMDVAIMDTHQDGTDAQLSLALPMAAIRPLMRALAAAVHPNYTRPSGRRADSPAS